jgi:hypothetical protein
VCTPYVQNILYRIIREAVDPFPQEYLLAHFLVEGGGNDFFLEIDPRRFEEVVLSHPYLGTTSGFTFARSILCSFHFPEEYARSGEYELTSENKQDLLVDSMITSVRFGGSRDLDGTAEMRVHPVTAWPAASTFYLDPSLKIRSITASDGREIPFLRQDDAFEGIVVLPPADSPDLKLVFQYNGDFLFPGPIFEMRSFTEWYPNLLIREG